MNRFIWCTLNDQTLRMSAPGISAMTAGRGCAEKRKQVETPSVSTEGGAAMKQRALSAGLVLVLRGKSGTKLARVELSPLLTSVPSAVCLCFRTISCRSCGGLRDGTW